MMIAKVQFQHEYDKGKFTNKHYDYLVFHTDLKKGDLVVVETQYGYSVAKFVKYSTGDRNPSKYIITKLDLSEFETKKQRVERIKEIESQIEARVAQVNLRKVYEQLAKHDEHMRELLAELDKESGGLTQ